MYDRKPFRLYQHNAATRGRKDTQSCQRSPSQHAALHAVASKVSLATRNVKKKTNSPRQWFPTRTRLLKMHIKNISVFDVRKEDATLFVTLPLSALLGIDGALRARSRPFAAAFGTLAIGVGDPLTVLVSRCWRKPIPRPTSRSGPVGVLAPRTARTSRSDAFSLLAAPSWVRGLRPPLSGRSERR